MREKGRWRLDVLRPSLGLSFWQSDSTLLWCFLPCQCSSMGTTFPRTSFPVCYQVRDGDEKFAQNLEGRNEVAARMFSGLVQSTSSYCVLCTLSLISWFQLVLWGSSWSPLSPQSHAEHLPDCRPDWPMVTSGRDRGDILADTPAPTVV